MRMQFAVLVVCLMGLAEGFPLAPPPSPSAPGRSVLIPVTVLSPYGPQVVLIPVSTAEWNTQRNLNATPQTPTPSHQHQMKSETVAGAETVNNPFLQPHTLPSPDAHTLPHTPESAQPQGQVFPVWNSLPVVPLQPSVTGQTFFPSLVTPAGGAGGQTQVVSVVQQAQASNSESSEEGDTTQVIYLLPVSAEIPNMGIAEGGQGGADLNPNTDPNLGHLQLPTPLPLSPCRTTGERRTPGCYRGTVCRSEAAASRGQRGGTSGHCGPLRSEGQEGSRTR
ncbi:hypothetical protein MHYP_G00089340 [Metynnis hypsauchen]